MKLMYALYMYIYIFIFYPQRLSKLGACVCFFFHRFFFSCFIRKGYGDKGLACA
jgi:hypothetical protein